MSLLAKITSTKREREGDSGNYRMKTRSEFLSEAPIPSVEEPYFWLTTDWLRQWDDNIFPPVPGNTSIQCSHGGVPVSKAGSMEGLSEKAWTRLLCKAEQTSKSFNENHDLVVS